MDELPLARAIDSLEHAEALDPAIDALAAPLKRVPKPVRDLLHGVPLGHPAHPAAVLVPAGCWVGSAVLDLLPGNETASSALVGVGVLTAAPVAASGLIDWAELPREQQRIGIVHAAVNSAAVTLYGLSFVARATGHHGLGKALGFAGLGALFASGYVGGHLAYRSGAAAEAQYAVFEAEAPDAD